MEEKKIAILIDAENVSYKNADQIIATMSERGTVLVKTIVSDWTKIAGAKATHHANRTVQIEGWRNEASKYSITGIQSFSHVSGKNTSDIALTIHAMTVLYEKPYINTFCIVSNDSDFTRLAQELREHDKEVIGMGERKAIKEFVNAFSEFIYLGDAIEEGEEVAVEKLICTVPEGKNNNKAKAKPKTKKQVSVLPKEQMIALKEIIDSAIEESGKALYSLIAMKMKKKYSDFTHDNYNCKNMSELMKLILPCFPGYEIYEEEIPNNPKGKVMSFKLKQTKKK